MKSTATDTLIQATTPGSERLECRKLGEVLDHLQSAVNKTQLLLTETKMSPLYYYRLQSGAKLTLRLGYGASSRCQHLGVVLKTGIVDEKERRKGLATALLEEMKVYGTQNRLCIRVQTSVNEVVEKLLKRSGFQYEPDGKSMCWCIEWKKTKSKSRQIKWH